MRATEIVVHDPTDNERGFHVHQARHRRADPRIVDDATQLRTLDGPLPRCGSRRRQPSMARPRSRESEQLREGYGFAIARLTIQRHRRSLRPHHPEHATAPIIMGHSFGGAFAQVLLDRGLGVAGVAIDSAAVKGVKRLPFSTLRTGWPILRNPLNRHRAVPLSLRQFRYRFANNLKVSRKRRTHRMRDTTCRAAVMSCSKGPAANHTPACCDPYQLPRTRLRAPPLLMIAGGVDHVEPAFDQSFQPEAVREVQVRADGLQGVRRSFAFHPGTGRLGGGRGLCTGLGDQTVSHDPDHIRNRRADGRPLGRLTRGAGVETLLADKVAVVTGGSRGIGLAVTRALAAEGAHVVVGARSTTTLDGLAGVTGMELDLAEASAPERLVQRAVDEHGHVDVLINNVGAVHLRLNGFLETTDRDFDEAMQLNFYTAVRASPRALAHMVARGAGAIVNIASVNAFYQPDGNTVDYGAAKAALVNLTKSLAQEFGSRGVHVNAVSPGPVSTDLWLGDNGVAATVGRSLGVDADTRGSRSSPQWAASPPGDSPHPKKSQLSSCSSHQNGQPT